MRLSDPPSPLSHPSSSTPTPPPPSPPSLQTPLPPTTTHRLRIRHDLNTTHVSPCIGPLPPDTVDLAYHLTGTGPHPVVFIAGMCVSHEMWHNQLTYFRPHHHLTQLMIDLRGTGDSSIDRSQYDIPILARDIWAIINHVFGIHSRVHLIGHSMGTMILQRAALQQPPQRLASLTLLGGHDGGWFWRFCPTFPMVRAALDVLSARFNDAVSATAFMRLHYTSRYLRDCTICSRTGEKRERHVSIHARYMAGFQKDRARSNTNDPTFWRHLTAARAHALTRDEAFQLKQLSCPKLVVYGRQDRVVLPRASRELAARIGAEVVAVDGAHFLFDETARDVNELIELHLWRAGARLGCAESGGRADEGCDKVGEIVRVDRVVDSSEMEMSS